jgi:hypothetical protein
MAKKKSDKSTALPILEVTLVNYSILSPTNFIIFRHRLGRSDGNSLVGDFADFHRMTIKDTQVEVHQDTSPKQRDYVGFI